MCRLVMSLLNLPQHLLYHFSNLRSVNIYLDILVDELMELNTMPIYNAHLIEEFDLSVRILSCLIQVLAN